MSGLQSAGRGLYWAFSGACMGIGLIAFGLGLVPFFLGLALTLLGVRMMGGSGLWVALVSMGVVPALLLTYQWAASGGPQDPTLPNPILPSLVFAAVALLGAIWGAARGTRSRHTRI